MGGKVGRAFYAMFTQWADVQERSIVTQCVPDRGKAFGVFGDCVIHPFVVRRPHRYARQSGSVRKTGSQKETKRGRECGNDPRGDESRTPEQPLKFTQLSEHKMSRGRSTA